MVSTGSQFVSHRLSIVCMDNRMPLQRQTPVFLGECTGDIRRAVHHQSTGNAFRQAIIHIQIAFQLSVEQIPCSIETVSYQFLRIPLTVPHKLPGGVAALVRGEITIGALLQDEVIRRICVRVIVFI
ncbi:hypothetical protein C4A68_03160 [Escherichia coli]|nr:hypothetical protein C4A73_02890 [Escherichia coli]RDO74297.1 hypothetical protein C4A68_03160 [Escherichia coli]RDO98648.1 hypothetical protein C4A63_00350 [Escherichia coli]